MDRSNINRLIVKNIIAFVMFFLFYAYQNYGVTPFPLGRCLLATLFVVLALTMLDLLDYHFCLNRWYGKKSGDSGYKLPPTAADECCGVRSHGS